MVFTPDQLGGRFRVEGEPSVENFEIYPLQYEHHLPEPYTLAVLVPASHHDHALEYLAAIAENTPRLASLQHALRRHARSVQYSHPKFGCPRDGHQSRAGSWGSSGNGGGGGGGGGDGGHGPCVDAIDLMFRGMRLAAKKASLEAAEKTARGMDERDKGGWKGTDGGAGRGLNRLSQNRVEAEAARQLRLLRRGDGVDSGKVAQDYGRGPSIPVAGGVGSHANSSRAPRLPGA